MEVSSSSSPEENISCISCGSKDLTKFYSQYDRDDKITDILLCQRCNALVPRYLGRNLLLTLEEQISGMDVALPISFDNAENLVLGYTNVIEFYKDLLSEPNYDDYMCEIGAGRGSLLEALKRKGYKVIGCEPSSALTKAAQKFYSLSNFEIQDCDAETLFDLVRKKSLSIKCVFMWHVLEHLSDPLKILKLISQSLSPKGLIIFQIPMLIKEQLHPDHLCFYTEPSVHYLARESNCEVVRVDYDHQRMFCSFALRSIQ